jgi:transposase
MAWIDNILEGDRSVHKKQRHTAQRIFERLRDEEGFSGGYTIVREYVAGALLRSREMFVPLSHRPGHAQADFGQADAYIAGKKVRFHYFCMDLPHSDGCFVKAYPAETAEAFCEGHVAAFDFFGGVPQSILYDNTRLAVAKIVKGGERLRKCSRNSRAITCSRTASADRARATTRARSRGWSAMSGATS